MYFEGILMSRFRFLCLLGILFNSIVQSNEIHSRNAIAEQSPFLTGSRTIFIHDFSRSFDKVGGIDSGVRTLIAEIWYPVDRGDVSISGNDYRRATYGDYVFGNQNVHRLMMTKTTFFHLVPTSVREGINQSMINEAITELFFRPRASFYNAPLSKDEDTHPVILMSHGDAGSRYNMESVCEFLAAHGYVVVAPEHTGNTPYSMIGADPDLDPVSGNSMLRVRMKDVISLLDINGVYGEVEKFGQSYSPLSENADSLEAMIKLDQSLLEHVNDLRITLDKLSEMQTSGLFEGRFDLSRIGLIGRSFGAVTTLVGLALEDRFAAGMAVAGLDFSLDQPKPSSYSKGSETAIFTDLNESLFHKFRKPTFLLNAADDALIISVSRQRSLLGDQISPSKLDPHPGLRQAYERSSSPVVWGMLPNANHASFGVSGSYWWPELKPEIVLRPFSNEPFRLVSPKLAHKIQRETALAFFNLTLRGEIQARDFLLSEPYTDQNFVLKARHLNMLTNDD